MAFHERSFNQRFAEMGDQAEAVYEDARPLGKTIRFGFRRPKGISFKRMPKVMRHAPDFYAESGYLVEVVGLGKDGILKSFKTEKVEALKVWNRISALLGVDLALFIWNSSEQQYVVLEWKELLPLIAKAKKKGMETFHEGNEYYPIEWEWITSTRKPIKWTING